MTSYSDIYGGKQPGGKQPGGKQPGGKQLGGKQPGGKQPVKKAEWSEAIQSVLEQPPASLPRHLTLLGMAFTGFFGLWAWTGTLQEVSQARGKLLPLGDTYKIQPATPGKVNEILVEEGQIVRKGQLLFRLDSTLLESEVTRLEQTLQADQQSLRQARSLIEKSQQESLAQQQIAEASIEAQLATWKQAQINTETNQALLISIDSEVAAHEERLARISTLEGQGAISREYVFNLEQGVRDQQKSLRQTQGEIEQFLAQTIQIEAELTQKQAEAQQIQVIAQQSSQKLEMEAEALQGTIEETQTLIEQARTRLSQSQMRSPSSGMVSSLEIANAGEFTQPGETLAEIVPEGTPLVLSTLVPQSQAGLIKPGMVTQIKLEAFPYQNYGILSGQVISMSSDAKGTPETGSGYRVDIDLAQDYIMHEQQKIPLQIGQTANAEIVVRKRKIIDLILDPIRRLRASDLSL